MAEIENATPRPWAVTSSNGDIHSQARNGRNWICQGPIVGALSCPFRSERQANAELIVRAENASLRAMNAELVAALEAAEVLYQVGILYASPDAIERVHSLRQTALARIDYES